MEEKRIDPLQIIGFFLLFLVLIWMMYDQSEMMEQNAQAKANAPTQTVNNNPQPEQVAITINAPALMDSIPEQITTIQNELLRLSITSKGGFIEEAEINAYTNYLDEQVYIIKDANTDFNLRIEANGSLINSRDLDFLPILDGNQLIMRSQVAGGILEFIYTLSKEIEESEAYRFQFDIRSSGLNVQSKTNLYWRLDGFRHALSADYENRYTQLTYQYEDGHGTIEMNTSIGGTQNRLGDFVPPKVHISGIEKDHQDLTSAEKRRLVKMMESRVSKGNLKAINAI